MRRLLCNTAQKILLKQKHLQSNVIWSSSSDLSIGVSRISSDSSGCEGKHESWSSLVWALAQGGTNAEFALFEASRIFSSGLKPNAYALVHLIRATTNLGWESCGQQLHSYILRCGYYYDVYVSAALIRYYVRMQSLGDARKVFVETPRSNVVSWNTLISGYVQSGHFRKALSAFLQLESSDIYADAFSFTSALAACGQLSLLKLGKSIHSRIMKVGMINAVVVANCLIDMYGKCGSVEDAVQVFSEMIDKDTVSWNSVIAASANNGNVEQAFNFLHHMPNPDTISYNGLINGIAQVGNIGDAIGILSTMPNPNSSSWNSIITGYVNRNQARKALDVFYKMHSKNIKMDEFTFSIILNGIAGLSALTWGMLIHCCTIKCGLDTSVVVGSALIDMYSNCGQVKNAESIFHSLPKKNLVSWNALISGYARNGDSAKVVQLFEMLKIEKHTKPDSITFLNLLSACSHSQISFEVATQYFESMMSDYGISPTVEHCCSLIQLMGRKGELWRAERMIYELGFELCGLVWRNLLSACATHRDLQVAEVAFAKVIELDGNEDSVYVIMSNMYSYFGRWEDVSIIRGLMREKQVIKEVGSSWIEVEDFVPSSIGL